jgi:hypothetical protein
MKQTEKERRQKILDAVKTFNIFLHDTEFSSEDIEMLNHTLTHWRTRVNSPKVVGRSPHEKGSERKVRKKLLRNGSKVTDNGIVLLS